MIVRFCVSMMCILLLASGCDLTNRPVDSLIDVTNSENKGYAPSRFGRPRALINQTPPARYQISPSRNQISPSRYDERYVEKPRHVEKPRYNGMPYNNRKSYNESYSPYNGTYEAHYNNRAPRSALPKREKRPYVLDSGDNLRINVFGQQNLSGTYTIDSSGYISMPLIGAVSAHRLTTFQLAEKISSQLRVSYIRDPKVTVEVSAYRPFFILGEVQNAGQYAYVHGMTAQTAVAIAGGYAERANQKDVRITRHIRGQPVTRMVPSNTLVRPGDTIFIKERFL